MNLFISLLIPFMFTGLIYLYCLKKDQNKAFFKMAETEKTFVELAKKKLREEIIFTFNQHRTGLKTNSEKASYVEHVLSTDSLTKNMYSKHSVFVEVKGRSLHLVLTLPNDKHHYVFDITDANHSSLK